MKASITFDDGPHPVYTPKILEILANFNVKAAFFVCGMSAEKYPDLVKTIVSKGHIVGNHSYSHSRLLSLTGLNFWQIKKTERIIDSFTKSKKLFRPPYGVMNPITKTILKKNNFKVVGYNVVGYDWKKNITVEKILANVNFQLKKKSIILLHDGCEGRLKINRQATVDALTLIIKRLKKLNFKIVPLTDMPIPI